MHGQSIAVIHDANASNSARTVWERIDAAWPAFAAKPTIRLVTFNDALREQTASFASCALLCPTNATERALVHAVVDTLASESAPAVLLLPKQWTRQSASQRDGAAIALPDDAEPLLLASAIFALLARQRTVGAMSRELATLRRFQGGLRTEINRMHDELLLAGKVQQQILPKDMPDFSPVAVDALFRPCGYVSGDIYDVQRINDTTIGFFLADAMGHGVPAALMTMVINRALNMVESHDGEQRIVSPAEALSRLNEALMISLGSSVRFATAVYGVIDVEAQSIRFAGAGHPPAMLFRANGGEPELLESSGPLLGIFDDAAFEEVECEFKQGDLLIVHSDGVETVVDSAPTVENNKVFVEREALVWREFAGEATKKGLAAAITALAALFDKQSGSFHQRDDVTVIALGMGERADSLQADSASDKSFTLRTRDAA